MCVLIHKRINQNKVRLAAAFGQSQHPPSCQKRFTGAPVESHEVAFFTEMSHKLQWATVLAMCASILPCGSVFCFFFLTVILDERRCLPGCLWPRGLGSQSRQPLSNIQHVSYRFSSQPGFISLPLLNRGDKFLATSSRIECNVFMAGFSAQFITHQSNILPGAYRDSLHILSFISHLLLCFKCTVCNSSTRCFSIKTKQQT